MASRRPTSSSRPKHPAARAEPGVRPADLDDHEAGHEGVVRLLEAAVEPVARAMGFEIVLVEWIGGRGHRVVRIYLDHPNGVSLDDCTRMSGVLSNALDAAEADPETPELAALLSQPYTLEVSSPGVDRPLVRLSHFARFVGSRAVVRTFRPLPGQGGGDQRTFHGRIVGTEVDAAEPGDDRRGHVLLRALDSDTIYKISLADIRRANLVYSPPGPAAGAAPGAPQSTGEHG
ncbi:MAG TPA: ribosome maturation factor RimP [Nannocystis sp.]